MQPVKLLQTIEEVIIMKRTFIVCVLMFILFYPNTVKPYSLSVATTSEKDKTYIKELLDKGIHPDSIRSIETGLSAIEQACINKDVEMIKLLLEYGAHNGKALRLASERQLTYIVETLIQHDISEINKRDSKGKTPLIHAIEGNNHNMIKF